MTPDAAFGLFTEKLDTWWPTNKFSVAMYSGGTVEKVVIEPHIGGAIYEVATDGTRSDWGRVTDWEPGVAFGMDWWPGHGPDEASHVRVEFTAFDGGTRVNLLHTGLSSRPDGDVLVDQYTSGWDVVLGALCGAA